MVNLKNKGSEFEHWVLELDLLRYLSYSKKLKIYFFHLTNFRGKDKKMYKILLVFWRMGELGILLSIFTGL